MTPEDKLNEAMDEFVESSKPDEKIMTWHIMLLAVYCVGFIWFLLEVGECLIIN